MHDFHIIDILNIVLLLSSLFLKNKCKWTNFAAFLRWISNLVLCILPHSKSECPQFIRIDQVKCFAKIQEYSPNHDTVSLRLSTNCTVYALDVKRVSAIYRFLRY